MSDQTFHVGQRVILRDLRKGTDREVTVVKVGRTYLYVDARAWGEWAYRIDTGYAKGGAFTPTERVGTAEMFAEWDRRAAASKHLREATRGYHWMDSLTVEQVEQIVAMIEKSKGKQP